MCVLCVCAWQCFTAQRSSNGLLPFQGSGVCFGFPCGAGGVFPPFLKKSNSLLIWGCAVAAEGEDRERLWWAGQERRLAAEEGVR